MTTLAIRKDTSLGAWVLLSGESINSGNAWYRGECRMDFGHPLFCSRPDPIQRAWSRLEAKWGMDPKQEAPAPQAPRPLVTRSALAGWFRRLAPWTPVAERENDSQRRAS